MPKTLKRPSPLSIRLSGAERTELEKRVGEGNLSTYVKDVLFGTGTASSPTSGLAIANRTLLSHLLATLGASQLAPNIDRLVREAESGELGADGATLRELRDACDDVRLMRNALMRGLGLKEGPPSRRQQKAVEAFRRASKPEDSQ